jgi:hypothetical protein
MTEEKYLSYHLRTKILPRLDFIPHKIYISYDGGNDSGSYKNSILVVGKTDYELTTTSKEAYSFDVCILQDHFNERDIPNTILTDIDHIWLDQIGSIVCKHGSFAGDFSVVGIIQFNLNTGEGKFVEDFTEPSTTTVTDTIYLSKNIFDLLPLEKYKNTNEL